MKVAAGGDDEISLEVSIGIPAAGSVGIARKALRVVRLREVEPVFDGVELWEIENCRKIPSLLIVHDAMCGRKVHAP